MILIEWTAAAFGVLGTLLLAFNGKHAGWGFVAFLASNIGWIAFALDADHTGMLVQQICFTATSILGIYRWLLKAATPNGDAGETLYPPGDLYTEFLSAHARIEMLERYLQAEHLNPLNQHRASAEVQIVGKREPRRTMPRP